MDKPVLMVEMPELSTQTIVEIYDFMQSVLTAFEAHYIDQLHHHWQSPELNEEIPF